MSDNELTHLLRKLADAIRDVPAGEEHDALVQHFGARSSGAWNRDNWSRAAPGTWNRDGREAGDDCRHLRSQEHRTERRLWAKGDNLMTTEERFERLERELSLAKRRTRWLSLAVVLTVAGLVVGWFDRGAAVGAESQQDALAEVRARAFVLVDATGQRRAALAVFEAGPGLALYDATGQTRAALAVVEAGPTLALYDATGQSRAGLRVVEDGARLQLADAAGTPRVTLGADRTSTPDGKTTIYPESSLLLAGPDGNVIWRAPR